MGFLFSKYEAQSDQPTTACVAFQIQVLVTWQIVIFTTLAFFLLSMMIFMFPIEIKGDISGV